MYRPVDKYYGILSNTLEVELAPKPLFTTQISALFLFIIDNYCNPFSSLLFVMKSDSNLERKTKRE